VTVGEDEQRHASAGTSGGGSGSLPGVDNGVEATVLPLLSGRESGSLRARVERLGRGADVESGEEGEMARGGTTGSDSGSFNDLEDIGDLWSGSGSDADDAFDLPDEVREGSCRLTPCLFVCRRDPVPYRYCCAPIEHDFIPDL